MEGGKKVVLDASLVVKWFSQEEGSEIAVRARDRHISGEIVIVAPDLLVYEVANALTFSPDFENADVKRAVKDIFDMELDLICPDEALMDRAVEYAFDGEMTVYDGCYVSLAELLGLELFTADRKLRGEAKNLDFVKSLEDLRG